MERLTIKNSDDTHSQIVGTKFIQFFDKVAEFEDFMEEQGFKSLEQLKEIIEIYKNSRRLCFGMSARKNGKYIMLMNEFIDLCKYKHNWQKLKEWGSYLCYFELVDKMEKLEKEIK